MSTQPPTRTTSRESTDDSRTGRDAVTRAGTAWTIAVWAIGLSILAALIVLGVTYGSTSIPASEVWGFLGNRLQFKPMKTGTTEIIIWRVRFPRPFLAAVVGAGLGVVGAAIQAIVRNPLADPYLLGVSSGASLGAVAVLVTGGGFLAGLVGPTFLLSTGAFLGALASFLIVWLVASRGAAFAPLRLILAGIAVGQVFGAMTSFLVLQADDLNVTHSVLFWLMGSLSGAIGEAVPVAAAIVGLGSLVLFAHARHLNALLMGDETASSLGVNPTYTRTVVFVVASLMTGVMVAFSGAIGFVGLVIPHIARFLVGTDHRRLIPASALLGAILLVAVDIVCRIAVHVEVLNQELPINIVSSLIGAPVLLYLLNRKMRAI